MSEEEDRPGTQDEAEEDVGRLVEGLSSSSRRVRQERAHVVAQVARRDPDALLPYVGQLVDALYRPEAQTRWEVLSALTELAGEHADEVAEAFDGAEASLFDDGSATVRLAAFLFLARLAGSSPERSEQAWPLLDEAVQCYHGDPEYRDMLQGMLQMARGELSDGVRESLVARVSFDAENGVGFIKTFSAQIAAAASGEGQ